MPSSHQQSRKLAALRFPNNRKGFLKTHKYKENDMGCIEKVHGGYKVDGLELLAGNCGCGGLTGPGGSGTGDCCFTFSRVKHEGDHVEYVGKYTTPNTTDNYEWGYKVKKGSHEVDVKMFDTRGPKTFKFGGHLPPPLSAWKGKGWQVVSQFERPLKGTGEPMPDWCATAESECIRPVLELESAKGDKKK
jgi:hypothetical protein